jgi:hypothetical protein
MIGYISIFEGISTFNMLIWICSTVETIDYFGLAHLLKYTTGMTLASSCEYLCVTNSKFGFQLFSNMSLYMNMFLCLDLILTLRSPFSNQALKMKFYLLTSFILCMAMVLMTMGGFSDICADGKSQFANEMTNLLNVITMNIYITFALFSIIYSSRMLGKPGISQQIKVVFL